MKLLRLAAVARVPIHVAQRYSVILETNQSTSTNYWLRGAMMTNCFTGDNPVLDPTTKAVISYSGGNNTVLMPSEASVDWTDALPTHCIDLDESNLVPATQDAPPGATKMWRIDFSFGIGAYQLDRAKVNGTSWSALHNTTTLLQAIDGLSGSSGSGGSHKTEASSNSNSSSNSWAVDGPIEAFAPDQFVVGVSTTNNNNQVDVVDILLYSLDEGSHPFHLHGHNLVCPLLPSRKKKPNKPFTKSSHGVVSH